MHPRVLETYSNHLNSKYWIYYAISNRQTQNLSNGQICTVSCKIINNYQNSIFFYEISYTYPRHMRDYPRENCFLIPILENSQNFRATYCSLQEAEAGCIFL